MNKTLHAKLTGKHLTADTAMLFGHGNSHTLADAPPFFIADLGHEMNLLREAAKDLLQPRPQAISRLLDLAKEL